MSIAKEIDVEHIEKSGYEIHEDGRIYSVRKNKFLNGCISKGYVVHRLYIDGRYQNLSAHRLVAAKYVPGASIYLEVNHKDKNKLNNSAANLEWVTTRQNTFHAFHGDHSKLDAITKMAIGMTKQGVGQIEIASRLGVCQSSVSGWTKGFGRSKPRHSAAAKSNALRMKSEGLSNKDIALTLGVGLSSVSRWLRGECLANS